MLSYTNENHLRMSGVLGPVAHPKLATLEIWDTKRYESKQPAQKRSQIATTDFKLTHETAINE